MLFQKLLKPAASSGATGIQYVGATTDSGNSSGFTVIVSLTGLTGGIASRPAIGDIVVISIGVAGSTNAPAIPTVSGYTQIQTQGASDTIATRIYTGYKILTAADTSVSYSWTASNGSSTAYVSVWRNVDATYPLDVSAVAASTLNGIFANPNPITPVTSGAYIVVAGAGGGQAGAQTYSSSDLTDFRSTGVNATYDSVIGGGYSQWTSGAFDPAAFSFSYASSATYSSASTTVALRPNTGRAYPSFVGSNGVVTGSSVSVPSHQAGDWVVVVSANATATPPGLLSGYTNITTFNNDATGTANDRAARVQYIVSDGTISSVPLAGYGMVAVLRNVTSVGVVNSVSSTGTSGSSTAVTVSGVNPGSLCLFSSYIGGSQISSVTSLTSAPNFGGYDIVPATAASSRSGNINFVSSTPNCFFGAEFR